MWWNRTGNKFLKKISYNSLLVKRMIEQNDISFLPLKQAMNLMKQQKAKIWLK